MLPELLKIARAAGREILRFYEGDASVQRKADDSPLTLADLASHRLICDELARQFPDIPICSEEGLENQRPDDDKSCFWLVDPLDGTKEFIKKTGHFTVNIALIEYGTPIYGVIHVPATGVSYHAGAGSGAYRIDPGGRERPIRVGAPPVVPRFVASRDHAGPEVKRLLSRFPGAECLSIGSSLKFCLVAEGSADIYLRDVPTMEWDTAAAHALLKEAGGNLHTWPDLKPLTYGKSEHRNGAIVALGDPGLLRRIAQVAA